MATLGLKEMGKFLWEGRKKGLPSWLSQFSKTGQTFFPYLPEGIFPFPSNLRQPQLGSNGKCKTWYSILGVDTEPLSIKNLLLSPIIIDYVFLLKMIYNLLLTFQSIYLVGSFSFLYYFHFIYFYIIFFLLVFLQHYDAISWRLRGIASKSFVEGYTKTKSLTQNGQKCYIR